MISVGDLLTFIENLGALKIENTSRVLPRSPKELSSIPRFRKLPTRVTALGSS